MVVLLVFSTIEERDVVLLELLAAAFHKGWSIGVSIEFGRILFREVWEAFRLMIEPLAQTRGRRNLFAPIVDGSFFFCHATRPKFVG